MKNHIMSLSLHSPRAFVYVYVLNLYEFEVRRSRWLIKKPVMYGVYSFILLDNE